MYGQAQRVFELTQAKAHLRTFSQSKRSTIISLISGKGGTGKSVLALNLAFALAEEGNKVLLVDLDSNFASLNIMLNFYSDETIYDLFLRKSLIEDVIFKYSQKLHIVAGDIGRTDYPRVSSSDVKYFFKELEKAQSNYNYILIDTSSGIGDNVLEIASNSDVCLLVANPEPTAILDAYAILKYLKSNSIFTKREIVVNKCKNEAEGKTAFENLKKAIVHFLSEDIQLSGIVNFGDEITKAVQAQEPLLKLTSKSLISQQIRGLAQKIAKFGQVANNNQTI